MSDLLDLEPAKEDEENLEPAIEQPLDMRPDLSVIGLSEIERGVVEDTYENRQALRNAQMNWDPVYAQNGAPTGLIAARTLEQSRERRMLSLQEKTPLLVDPKDKNSDYLTGLDLVIDEEACRIVPPWVIGSTQKYLAEKKAGGPPTAKRAPLALPHRCRIIKTDGLRCMLWSSGRIKDDGLCRIHLRTQRKPGEDVERARRKLIQAAPYAVDVLEDLMENAVSEPVKLKASTEILDRAGLRGGMEIDMGVEVKDARSPAQIVAERLARLADGATRTASLLQDENIQDAEVVTEEPKEIQPTASEDEEVTVEADDTEL
jgi:hypothetical protein